jgi:hypothetical protein
MCRTVSLGLLSSTVLFALGVQAQAVPPGEPPVPPDTEAALAPPASPPPSAAEPAEVPAEPVLPWPQPEPAPGESGGYPSEPAPEVGPEPPVDPGPGAPADAAAAAAPVVSSDQPARPVSVAALVGIGVTFDNTVSGINPLGFGFGLRGDYRFAQGFALGARLMYFVGGSSELPTGNVELNTWLAALEGSWVFDLQPILIQPGLLLGIATRSTHGLPAYTDTGGQGAVAGTQNHTAVGMYVAPGVNVVVPLGLASHDMDRFFVGGDLRFDLVFGDSVSANLQVLAQVGLNF